MALRTKYQSFLRNPTAADLADDASLHYITTLTTISQPAAIVKHFAAQAKQLIKKSEKVIGAIEGEDGLCLDVETTLEFLSGGGAFLPGLDDNFLTDKTVIFPVIHIVHFDANQKIDQIRLHWDQGSLLKEIGVIGARGRNWPVRDAKDQVRTIASSAAPGFSTTDASSGSVAAAQEPEEPRYGRGSRSGSKTSATGDPHASLSLFERPDTIHESAYPPPSGNPRASAKPASRNLTDILAGSDNELGPPSPTRLPSPRKTAGAPKGGAGKHYHANRLFDENDLPPPKSSPEKLKTHPKKYQHFEFGDEPFKPTATETKKKYQHFEFGEDPVVPSTAETKKTKHSSQWDFADFVTPDKPRLKVKPQNERHFGWSDDDGESSPIKRPVVHRARPDAETHFEFVDDGTPAGEKKQPGQKGRVHNEAMGLYRDLVHDGEGDDAGNKGPLNAITSNINNQNRRKDFGAHWEMVDYSPSTAPQERNGKQQQQEEEDAAAAKENVNTRTKGIKTGGDGMGGRKDTMRNWDFADDATAEPTNEPITGKGAIARRQPQADKDFWDF